MRAWTQVIMVVLLLAGVPAALADDSSAPNWDNGIAICRDLQTLGWEPSNPTDETLDDEAEVEIDGAGTLCAAKKIYRGENRSIRGTLRFFTGTRVITNLTIAARISSEADKAFMLGELVKAYEWSAAKLGALPPRGFVERLRGGTDSDVIQGGARFRCTATTRASAIIEQPGLKEDAVPWIEVEAEIEPYTANRN